MSAVELSCGDVEATMALGARLGAASARVAGAFCIGLRGTLGAGKTTLARGLLRGLGVRGAVRSPTFTLVETYACGAREVVHLDLYRVGEAASIEGLGLRDYDRATTLWVIEWPERGGRYVPAPDLTVTLSDAAQGGRVARLVATSAAGRQVLGRLDTADSCQAE